MIYLLDSSRYFFKWYNENKQKIENNSNHSLLFDNIKLFLELNFWNTLEDFMTDDLQTNLFYKQSWCKILFDDDLEENLLQNYSDIIDSYGSIQLKRFNLLPKRLIRIIDGNNILRKDILVCYSKYDMPDLKKYYLINNILLDNEKQSLFNLYLYKTNNNVSISDYDTILQNLQEPIDLDYSIFEYLIEIFLNYMINDVDDKFNLLIVIKDKLNEYMNFAKNYIFTDYLNKLKYSIKSKISFYFFMYCWQKIFNKLKEKYKYVFSW